MNPQAILILILLKSVFFFFSVCCQNREVVFWTKNLILHIILLGHQTSGSFRFLFIGFLVRQPIWIAFLFLLPRSWRCGLPIVKVLMRLGKYAVTQWGSQWILPSQDSCFAKPPRNMAYVTVSMSLILFSLCLF